jgi:predicted  nucleic acid-binding Zn-ribbon protein
MSSSLVEQLEVELTSLGKSLKQTEAKWQEAEESATYARRTYEEKEEYADKLWEERRGIEKRIQELQEHLEGAK